MDKQRNTQALLGQIPRPSFLVQEGRITDVNQAAEAMLLSPEQDFLSLVPAEDYSAFQNGQLCLSLTIAGQSHRAIITRMEDADLVVLEDDAAAAEFRSMALVSMELRKSLTQAITAARQTEDNASMNRSLMQMLRLAGNLSDISRYTVSARMEVRDVDSFLLELFEKAAGLTENGVKISFEGLKYPIFSQIDPEQMERAVWNILSNCLRFTPAGGEIRARLTRQGRFLRLTIEDSGSGIAGSVGADLFQRYLRQPGLEDGRFGLGLGLSIVRAVTANHGGTLLITAPKEGGTRVIMTLAIRQDDTTLRSPQFRLDYTGGFDHALVELSTCLGLEHYRKL